MQSSAALLTHRESKRTLTTLSKKIANGFGRSLSQGAGDCTKQGESLFLCPKSIMVGVLGSVRACRILDSVVQPDTSTAQSLDAFCGSLKTTVKELAMLPHYNQNPTKPNTPTLNIRLKSLFILLDANKRTIVDGLTFEQIKPIADDLSGSIIKFQKMEAVQ